MTLPPTDSTLLWDSIRVLIRLLERAEEMAEGITTIDYRNHQRVAKKRTRAICYTRGLNEFQSTMRSSLGSGSPNFSSSTGRFSWSKKLGCMAISGRC